PVFAVAAALFLLWRGDRGDAANGILGMGLGDFFTGVGRLLRNRAVLGLCLMAGLRTMAQNGLLMFLPLYLVDVLKADPLETGSIMMAMQIGGIVAVVIAGTLSDRIGRRPIVVAGLGASTVVIAGLTLLGGGPLYVAGVALLGFVLFAVRPVVHSWMMDLTPGQMGGSATSLMFGAQASLSAIVPLAGGLVADHWGLPSVFYMLAAVMLMANVTAVLLPGKPMRSE
ncbi:MFS transporter, partial [Pseudomonadota bacterium]